MTQLSEAQTSTPADTDSMDNNIVAIIIATISSSVFIVAILVLLLLLYHRDPLCCQFLCSCRLFQSPSQSVLLLTSIATSDWWDPSLEHSEWRQVLLKTLVSREMNCSALEALVAISFHNGSSLTYQAMRAYEKRIEQREIHQMIADRFGLWAEVSPELPPPYEQALRYPAALSRTGASSELSTRQSLPDMLQASPTYQAQRNTSV